MQTGGGMDPVRVRVLLKIWQIRCHRSTLSRNYRADWSHRWDAFLTTLNVVASIALLWLGVASQVPSMTIPNILPAIGVAGLIAVISSVIQYILDYKTLHIEHRRVAVQYAALDRQIEKTLAAKDAATQIDDINAGLDRVAKTAPMIPSRMWRRHNTPEVQRQLTQLQETLSSLDELQPANGALPFPTRRS
jgi:hypothetical protein